MLGMLVASESRMCGGVSFQVGGGAAQRWAGAARSSTGQSLPFPLINKSAPDYIAISQNYCNCNLFSSIFQHTVHPACIMEAIKNTVNEALEKLNLTGGAQAAPAKEPTEEQLNELKSKYEKAGQEQVFAFYDKLPTAEKAALFAQLSNFNPGYINEITERALKPAQTESTETKLEPLPESATSSTLDTQQDDLDKWYNSGLELIADNKVAVVLMAGGQGTRLGSSDPKGCYDIGLPSKKSLFQLQGERIAKAELLAKRKHGKDSVTIPWYVMTSGPTRKPTEAFFEKNNYFGLKKENVVVFEQGVLPCISNEGKILLESKSKVRQ